MPNDLTGIGLSPEAERINNRLVEDLGWFNEAQEAARLAMAYALERGVGIGSEPNRETRWTISLFDRTGEIQSLVAVVYPACDTPVRQIEHLVNQGLRMIGERLDSGAVTPLDLMAST